MTIAGSGLWQSNAATEAVTGTVGVAGKEALAIVTIPGDGIRDSAGGLFNPDSLAQTLNYNAAGDLSSVVATDGVNTWTQTLTYTSGSLTGISKWVKA